MIYKGEHSVTFGDKHSWRDFHLVPTSRPVIPPPTFKERYVDIPGRNGAVDLGSLLTGGPVYANRIGSIEFLVAPDIWPSWIVAYTTILTYLHGQAMRMTLDDDPAFYYEGRFTVNQWQSGQSFSTIVIDYNVQPFKVDVQDSAGEWLWDPFDFESGIIRDYADIVVSPAPATNLVTVVGHPYQRELAFTTSSAMSLTFEGKTYSLPLGRSSPYGVVIKPGENTLEFIGNGTVDILYRGGSL